MRCVKCGEATRVTDSRDDSNERNDWLLKAGERVFGWWSSDFRLRKRQCLVCERRETTIEITLSDLENSFEDLREQLSVTECELENKNIRVLAQDDLEALSINLSRYPNRTAPELALTRRTIIAIVAELIYRRAKQRGGKPEHLTQFIN